MTACQRKLDIIFNGRKQQHRLIQFSLRNKRTIRVGRGSVGQDPGLPMVAGLRKNASTQIGQVI